MSCAGTRFLRLQKCYFPLSRRASKHKWLDSTPNHTPIHMDTSTVRIHAAASGEKKKETHLECRSNVCVPYFYCFQYEFETLRATSRSREWDGNSNDDIIQFRANGKAYKLRRVSNRSQYISEIQFDLIVFILIRVSNYYCYLLSIIASKNADR